MDTPRFRLFTQSFQFVASILFVGLYVLDTYSAPVRGSPRYYLELLLCCVFAAEYVHRLATKHPDMGSKFRMVTSPRNIIDLLSFAPPLVEAALQQWVPGFTLGRLDLRWVKLLRSMRVMRVGLLGAELRSLHLSTKRGGWLNAGANFRLVQLATSVFMLLFIASAIIQVVEQMPFHKAIYLVATTLSTVGYGDVVATSLLGRAAIMAMIAVGIVLLPVQAAQFYSELSARRVIRGSLPDWRGKPFVLLSTRLTEVRAFSDFFSEFQQALGAYSRFPRATKLVALCNRPSYEFSAFQELHDRAVTLVEGSAVSGQDLVTVQAERSKAVLLIADRFTTDPESEDLGILFQVWACKSYTKTVPLFVQTLKESTVRQIEPFLDLGQDVIVSTEETRFRMLALSAVCPGASTLIGNLMRSSAVLPLEAQGPTLAGRKWMRQYVNGTAFSFCNAAVQRHLSGRTLADVAEWLFRSHGFVVIGIIDPGGRVRLNPNKEVLRMGSQLLVVGTDKRKVRKAMAEEFVALEEGARERAVVAAETDGWGLALRSSGSINGRKKKEGEEEGKSEEEEMPGSCVPVLWANFESDSIDPDTVPCVPPDIASSLRSEEDVRQFMYRFENSPRAKSEQASAGALQESTAQAIVSSIRISNSTTTSSTPSSTTSSSTGGGYRDNLMSPISSNSGAHFKNHYILCGHAGSIVPFMDYLRVSEASRSTPIVVLAPHPPADFDEAQRKHGPIVFVPGSPAEASSLREAGAPTAKALVFLARGSRPVKTAQATGAAVEKERSTREAVLADANALLACYGVGEESGTTLTHAVVELLFTTSIEFLQPGLLLKGISSIYEKDGVSVPPNTPRKSWVMRAWQQGEAVAEGLAEWQANPYYAAGRVTVPALMDTFATQCFFGRGLLVEVLAEMCWDLWRYESAVRDGSCSTGALLQLIQVPKGFAGRAYGELFTAWAVGGKGMICLGLYRSKTENPLTRLSYVVANPPPTERLEGSDRVFVLVDRPAGPNV